MYERILVPVDDSPTSALALHEAIRLAQGRPSRLRVVHVIDTVNINAEFTADIARPMRESGRKILRDAEAHARKAGVEAETNLLEIEMISDRISDLVAREAESWNADVIVMGTHGRRGLNRLFVGSVAEGVVRTAPVPVLLVRGK